MIESCVHGIKITRVNWKRSPIQLLKLNTDGSAIGNPGKIRGGGILNYNQGIMIHAFTVPLGQGTNNQAEIHAACVGINWCIQQGYKHIILEVDLELLARWITSTSTLPWQL